MLASSPSVLLVDLSLRFGGADVRVMQMARALHASGRHYAVATLAGSPVQQRLAAEGLAVRPLPFRRSDPRLGAALFALIRREGFAVVDAHNPQSQYWGLSAARLAGVGACVATVHSHYRDTNSGFFRPRLHEGALRLNSRLGCRFLTVSATVRSYVLSLGVSDERVTLSYNGIEFDDRPVQPAGLRAELGWGEDTRVAAIVARLDPVKGHSFLLRALYRLRDRQPGLRLLVIGDGPEDAALRAEAQRLALGDMVHFTGFRADVPALLAEADLFCLPSKSEGLPYTALEAALRGLPLVMSDIPGLAEFFIHDATAWLVPPGNPEALAEALDRSLRHPEAARALGETARALVRDRFDTRRMVAETLSLYDDEAARGHRL
ncbi:MAG TPA: glycosyltransferase [Azospirillaceae bacterium]|nr:glycosyltransferase [Azospirillaceae bacterium]